jgi:hypothetical protein
MSNRDWQKPIKRLLREAWATQHNLPRTGTRPAGYGSTMPDYIRDVAESYGYDAATIGRITPTAEQIDRLDMVLAAMAQADLDSLGRALLWLRAANLPWKNAERKHKMSRVRLWRLYERALAEFALTIIERDREKRAA